MNRRQADILKLLDTDGEIGVAAAAKRFHVTPATIRRDLQQLEDAGHLTRSHGGAILSPTSLMQLAFARRSREMEREKRAIGQAVAAEIRSGMIVSLDTGTTTLEVARAIAGIHDIKVLTTSLQIAAILHTHEHIEVILMGGTVRKNDPDLSGVLTEENLRRFRADVAVMGADAAGREGAYTGDMTTARGAQAMISGTTRRVLAIDSGKFSRQGLFRYAAWNEFAAVYTDDAVPRDARKWLDTSVAEVHYVKAGK